MTCDELADANVPALYLSEGLSGPEQEAYEAHYFECDRCFQELQTLRAAQSVLASESRSSLRARASRPARWLSVAAAVVTVTAAALWWRSGPSTPPRSSAAPASPGGPATSRPGPTVSPDRPQLLALARFEPPRYDPPRLRGSSPPPPELDRAMADYRRGDFSAAIPGLRKASERDPTDLRSTFFLAVCYLATGQPEPAILGFERVVSAGGSAYEEEAWFLRAKAEIMSGDSAAAVAALDRVITLEGDRDDEARDLRARLLALTRSGPEVEPD